MSHFVFDLKTTYNYNNILIMAIEVRNNSFKSISIEKEIWFILVLYYSTSTHRHRDLVRINLNNLVKNSLMQKMLSKTNLWLLFLVLHRIDWWSKRKKPTKQIESTSTPNMLSYHNLMHAFCTI